jgi:hypothetical protein
MTCWINFTNSSHRCNMDIHPIDVVVQILNSAYAADPHAVHCLIMNCVPCNQALADHPYVTVQDAKVSGREGAYVGAIGLINGIVAPLTGMRVAAKFGEPDNEGVRRITGFVKVGLV